MNGFVLINGKGEEYNLFDIKKSPAFNVDGWGYEDVTEFIRIGSTYCPLTEETAQRVIETALSFYDEADKRYRAFVDFAIQDPLTIRYTNDVGSILSRAGCGRSQSLTSRDIRCMYALHLLFSRTIRTESNPVNTGPANPTQEKSIPTRIPTPTQMTTLTQWLFDRIPTWTVPASSLFTDRQLIRYGDTITMAFLWKPEHIPARSPKGIIS